MHIRLGKRNGMIEESILWLKIERFIISRGFEVKMKTVAFDPESKVSRSFKVPLKMVVISYGLKFSFLFFSFFFFSFPFLFFFVFISGNAMPCLLLQFLALVSLNN